MRQLWLATPNLVEIIILSEINIQIVLLRLCFHSGPSLWSIHFWHPCLCHIWEGYVRHNYTEQRTAMLLEIWRTNEAPVMTLAHLLLLWEELFISSKILSLKMLPLQTWHPITWGRTVDCEFKLTISRQKWEDTVHVPSAEQPRSHQFIEKESTTKCLTNSTHSQRAVPLNPLHRRRSECLLFLGVNELWRILACLALNSVLAM